MNIDKLTLKKQQLDGFRPMPLELVKNLDEWFKVELTYTSNALEQLSSKKASRLAARA
jgi:hypothetical protein